VSLAGRFCPPHTLCYGQISVGINQALEVVPESQSRAPRRLAGIVRGVKPEGANAAAKGHVAGVEPPPHDGDSSGGWAIATELTDLVRSVACPALLRR
jgi:hypothetical protein